MGINAILQIWLIICLAYKLITMSQCKMVIFNIWLQDYVDQLSTSLTVSLMTTVINHDWARIAPKHIVFPGYAAFGERHSFCI